MRIVDHLLHKKAKNAALDALPDEQLVKQTVSTIITQPPSNLLKDHALPKDWMHIDYTFWVDEVLPNGSVVAKDALWATSLQEDRRQKYVAGGNAGLLVTQLYSQMRDRNQAWVRCDLVITRSAINEPIRFKITFSHELGMVPSTYI